MKRNLHIGRVAVNCISANSSRICYVLSPVPIDCSQLLTLAETYRTNIAVIHGMDWANDMTPWRAPGVPEGCPPFEGHATAFLELLRNEVIPRIDECLGLQFPCHKIICGVSLSGLFALWTWLLTDMFDDMASISGSMWYPDFVEWVKMTDLPHKSGKAYFSLGKLEEHSSVKVFNTVKACTDDIVELLRSRDVNVIFQTNPGAHYAPLLPRLDRALAALTR